MLVALGGQDFRPFQALGLHLAVHCFGNICRRAQIGNFYPRDFNAPRICRGIDDVQQPRIDIIAVGQDFVEIHGTDHGTDIGQGQILNGVVEIVDFIGCRHRIDHLNEHDGIA